MLIETNASTIRAIEPLLEEGEKDRGRGKPDLRCLRAFHYQAIERVYGDHGQEIVDHIKRAPLVAINVVLPRLKQKDEEWRKARRDMNKIWRDVYKDNYHKSLDHRSFYFKQLDKKG
jgi:paired amphipathic helix protein Sin3a